MSPLRTSVEWARDKQKSQPDPQKRLASSGIPRRFWSSEWHEYHEDTACQAVGDTTRDESLKQCLQAYADGWEPGQYDGLVLLGPAGHGKTLGAALVAKQLCLEANVWVKYTSNVDLGEQHKELFELQHASMRFEDITSTTTVSGIIAKIQQYQPAAVFIDGVYLMDDENGEAKGSSQAITNITRSLKRAAQTFQIPIIATTQTLYSKMQGGKKVSASSVGYSSSFSQDADTLIGIEEDECDGLVAHRLKVLLCRSGPVNEVDIDFNWSTSIITEIGGDEDYDEDVIDRRAQYA